MKARAITLLVLVAVIALVEVLSLTGRIDRITMQPPHQMATDLWKLLASGELNRAILQTLGNALIAFALSLGVGIAAASFLQGRPVLRDILEPLFSTYYAVPVFAFYPLLIVMFGLGDGPQITIGFLMGVVAVIVNTLNGLDRVPRVLRKVAQIQRIPSIQTTLRVTLPFAWPYVLNGARLALSYALVGIIASEFIMSRGGMGYEIGFAYNNFDNARMYPLILLLIIVTLSINALLSRWEDTLLSRRGLK